MEWLAFALLSLRTAPKLYAPLLVYRLPTPQKARLKTVANSTHVIIALNAVTSQRCEWLSLVFSDKHHNQYGQHTVCSAYTICMVNVPLAVDAANGFRFLAQAQKAVSNFFLNISWFDGCIKSRFFNFVLINSIFFISKSSKKLFFITYRTPGDIMKNGVLYSENGRTRLTFSNSVCQ